MRPDPPIRLRLFPEVPGSPLLWNDEGDSIALEDLPLPAGLIADLEAWGDCYGRFALGTAHPYPEDDPAFDLDRHNREGEALATRVDEALGAAWRVEHVPLRRGG